MDLKISGHSTALYSTYWLVEPLGLLLDCGDGAASFFQQKGRKAKYIACSHPDRDHLSGLLQFIQLNAQPGYPTVLYPKDAGSYPAMENFLNKFDPHVIDRVKWQGIESGDRIQIKKNCVLECYNNRHRPHTDGAAKSLSFSLFQDRKKLKPEYKDLPGPQIGQLVKEKGDAIYDTVTDNVLTYSADTPIESPEFWRDPKVLIHEATFLTLEAATSRNQEARHSSLFDVIAMATQMPSLEKLILGHFSCRYHHHQIVEAIEKYAIIHDLKIPVYGVTPGESKWDLLAGTPLWQPKG